MMYKNLFFLFGLAIISSTLQSNPYGLNQLKNSVRYPENPRVTIITSVFKSDEFMQGFLEDIVQQTIFEDCELLLINACSPGKEEDIILQYKNEYPNITYVKLDFDPGLYGVWNMGLHLARSAYVTNANTDDRLAFNCYELHAQALDKAPHIDLVYSDFYITKVANETLQYNSAYRESQLPEFDPGYMYMCFPNNHPMWRVSMHEKTGDFDASYKMVGDWEMWCRAMCHQCIFKKVPGVLGLFYFNPTGLSFSEEKKSAKEKEVEAVKKKYGHLFFTDQSYPRYKHLK